MGQGRCYRMVNGVFESQFFLGDLFYRPFELKWCKVSFLARKSRAVCEGLIAFDRGEACAKTACSCRCSQENRNVYSPKSKLLLIRIKFLTGKTAC